MGNHDAGAAIGRAAAEAIRNRQPGESALAILDRICEPWRGCDAEWENLDATGTDPVTHRHLPFDHYDEPTAPLGSLMVEAFAPNGAADLQRYIDAFAKDDGSPQSEAAIDSWWDEVKDPFKKRYEFC